MAWCAVGFRQLSVLSLILFKVTVKNPHKTLLMKWKSVQIYPPAYRCLCFLSPNNCSLRFSFMILKGLFLSNNESEQSTSCAFWSLDCGGRWAGIGGLGVRALPFFFLSLLTLFIFTLQGWFECRRNEMFLRGDMCEGKITSFNKSR